MADYLAYGFSVYEIEVKNHIILRVFLQSRCQTVPPGSRGIFIPKARAFGQLILRQLQLPIRRGKSEA